jgi:hypothetical protein
MDSSTLRATLLQTRVDQQSIQKSAAGMMSHYGGVPSVAVNEWRQCLGLCHVEQLLPLLYVANEVLQTSKRNRGNQFLEGFSSILGKGMQVICQRLHSESADSNDGVQKVEKARRVVKIWGDRHVFSVRFVTEILVGVEDYRKPIDEHQHGHGSASFVSPLPVAQPASDVPNQLQSSLRQSAQSAFATNHNHTQQDATTNLSPRITSSSRRSTLLSKQGSGSKTDIFGSPAGASLLRVDVGNIESPSSSKRKRTIEGGTGTENTPSLPNIDEHHAAGGSAATRKDRRTSSSGSKKKHKPASLSLVDILNELDDLNLQFRSLQRQIDSQVSANKSTLEATSTEIENLVGDELSDMYSKAVAVEKFLKSSAVKQMRRIAQRRYELEQMLLDKIPPLRLVTLEQDEEDLKLSQHLHAQLELLRDVHGDAKEARERQVAEHKEQKEMLASERLAKLQEEAQKKALQEALAKPKQEMGTVWNPVTREFQPTTDATQAESWRDN